MGTLYLKISAAIRWIRDQVSFLRRVIWDLFEDKSIPQAMGLIERVMVKSTKAEMVERTMAERVMVESTMAEECGCMQLIDWTGEFNVGGFENFGKEVEMDGWGVSYVVVSVMGPQSGGKSTLLNHLFDTKFREMDASKGRKQTTRGIWVARYAGIKPCTLVMDLEGSDGRERGENDTKFEKWSTLFALALSDIVLINMWCHDVGRENAANKPLLRTVFQVMLRICSPRKVTLMFVLRDKTKTPLNVLREDVLEDMEKIWNSIGSERELEEFFDVKVEALCNFEEKPDQFKKQVAGLRQKIFHSIESGGVDGDQRNVVPASSFSFKAQEIWKEIKDNKDLDIPAVKFMVAKVRCEEIAKEKFERFTRDYEVKKGFGKLFIISLRNTCLSEYDKETLYYDEVVRSEKRKELEEKLLQQVTVTVAVTVATLAVAASVTTIGIAVTLAFPPAHGIVASIVAGMIW